MFIQLRSLLAGPAKSVFFLSRSKSRRHTDSPSSDANQSTRSESTTDKEPQAAANGHAAAGPSQGHAAGTANAAFQQSSPHRMQQFTNFGPPGANKGDYNAEQGFRGSTLLVKTTHAGTIGKFLGSSSLG